MSDEELIKLIKSDIDRTENLKLLCQRSRDRVFRASIPFLSGQFLVDDLMKAGLRGLKIAVEKYDLESGLSFNAFSLYWIRYAMSQFMHGKPVSKIKAPAAGADPAGAKPDDSKKADRRENVNIHDLAISKMLNNFRESGDRLASMRQKLQDLGDIHPSAVQSDVCVTSGNTPDQTGKRAVSITMMEDKYKQELFLWLDQYQMFSDLIDQLPERIQRVIIISRYVLAHTWEEVVKLSGFSDHANVFRIHRKALQELDVILQDRITHQIQK